MSDFNTGELASLYALDALDDIERARFEAYLGRNPDAVPEVDEFRSTVARLANAAAEPAPASMRSAVLDRVSKTPQVRRAIPLQPRRLGRATTIALAAAAAVALASFGRVAMDWRQERNEAQSVSDVLMARDGRTVELLATPDAVGNPVGRVVYSPEKGRAVVVLDSLPEAGERNEDYQLWLIQDGVPRSIGLFDGQPGSLREIVEASPSEGDQLGLSIEPDGGSPQPTGSIVLLGDV